MLMAISVAWLPQLLVICVMVGSAGPHFNFSEATSASAQDLNAKRITFFSLALSIGLAWAPLAADYYVYYPSHIKSWRTFIVTVFGSLQAMSISLLMGIGLGTVISSSAYYAGKYGSSPGGVLMTAYDSLGGFGKFCAVINVLSLVANNTPGAYSMGMNFQMLGGVFGKVPRPVFTTLATIIYAACAMGGRNALYEVFKGFLPLIGYWVMMFVVIMLEEDTIFRRTKGYDWTAWDCQAKLPVGLAAAGSFLIGWAGAVVGMVSRLKSPVFLILTFNDSLRHITWAPFPNSPVVVIWAFGWLQALPRSRSHHCEHWSFASLAGRYCRACGKI